jgi:hypothetical protein
MTAEIAIMNTKGIALAADSAVTFRNINKTYNTADKLFALSKYHPVGIMIYGSVSIMGIEWETIIKSYRDSLGNKSFDKFSEYSGDFINYLNKFSFFNDERMTDYLDSMCFNVFSKVLEQFLDDIHKAFDNKKDIEITQIDTVFNTTLKNIKETLKEIDDQKQIKADFEFIDSNSELINKILESTFENYQLSEDQITELTDILKLNFQKCKWDNNPTGIVIAGYGDREIFPSINSFLVSGKLGDSLIYYGYEICQIGTTHTAILVPFAQTEVVQQFSRGIDNKFLDTIIYKVEDILISLSSLMNDNVEKINAISILLEEYITKYSNVFFKEPILDIVEGMEKSELVSMAEAMVNLTALKRHVTTEQESVGGPIDVALITKGEGFIWIKKKTNYDPHLNRDLNQNYFRS